MYISARQMEIRETLDLVERAWVDRPDTTLTGLLYGLAGAFPSDKTLRERLHNAMGMASYSQPRHIDYIIEDALRLARNHLPVASFRVRYAPAYSAGERGMFWLEGTVPAGSDEEIINWETTITETGTWYALNEESGQLLGLSLTRSMSHLRDS